MMRTCDSSQRRLAVFLLTVVITEVAIISLIIKHEHKLAGADWKRKPSDKNVSTRLSQVSIMDVW